MGESVHAYIALGSNLGARVLHLERACRALRATPGIVVVSASRIYQTEPVGPAGQGPYLNAALELRTELLPRKEKERFERPPETWAPGSSLRIRRVASMKARP